VKIRTPGTYFEMNGKVIKDHCYPSKSKTYEGDQWVHVEALVYGDSLLVHLVEGDTVLTYEHPRIDDKYIGKSSEYSWEAAFVKDYEQFVKRKGELIKSGFIALQAESHPIDFKNIQLLNLEGCMDKQAKNYKSYYIKSDKNQCKY